MRSGFFNFSRSQAARFRISETDAQLGSAGGQCCLGPVQFLCSVCGIAAGYRQNPQLLIFLISPGAARRDRLSHSLECVLLKQEFRPNVPRARTAAVLAAMTFFPLRLQPEFGKPLMASP